MPDISAYQDRSCPSRGDCARYRVRWNPYRQSVSVFDRGDEVLCLAFFPATRSPFALIPTAEADARNTRHEESR